MTFPDSEFCDCVTLARLFDSSRNEIKEMVHRLKAKGYMIETLAWGKQGKMKVHYKQFRAALMAECGSMN